MIIHNNKEIILIKTFVNFNFSNNNTLTKTKTRFELVKRFTLLNIFFCFLFKTSVIMRVKCFKSNI